MTNEILYLSPVTAVCYTNDLVNVYEITLGGEKDYAVVAWKQQGYCGSIKAFKGPIYHTRKGERYVKIEGEKVSINNLVPVFG